jgi:glycine cleavage system H protein
LDVTVGDKTYKLDDGALYIKSHQWVKQDGDVVLLGVTDFAQAALGEISLIELSSLDEGAAVIAATFDGNDATSEAIPDVSIESAKTVSDVHSPVAGTVAAINEDLEDEPEKVNEDPYGAWLIKIKASNWDGDKANLMDAAAYGEYLKTL